MKFNLLLEELLNELSGEEIYQKYYSKMPYEDFIAIATIDPQTKVDESNRIEKLGKYAKLFLSMYQRGGIQMEDKAKATEYIGYVYNYNIPLDINSIKGIGDLYNVVKEYIVKDTKSLSEILKVLDKSEYQFLLDGENWFIFKPLTEKAACYLGVNTEWCTAWGKHSLNKAYRDRESRFAHHHKQGPLYIIINKSNNDNKYQFHFQTSQYMDSSDGRINTKSFLKENPEILNFFFPSFTREVSNEELTTELTRIDVLDSDMAEDLITKATKNTDNQLAIALIKKDLSTVASLFDDEDVREVDIYSGKLEITITRLSQDAESLESTLSNFEYDSYNSWEWVYNDLTGRDIDKYETEEILGVFKSYYENNKEDVRSNLGFNSFDKFKEYYFDNYLNNDKIIDAFIEDIVDASHENYEASVDAEIDKIKSVMTFSNNTIDLDIPKLIKTLLVNDIREIGHESITFWDFIDRHISEYGLPTEYEPIYDYQTIYPKYGDSNKITRVTDEYFEEIFEDNIDCAQYRDKLNTILKKFFKLDSFGQYVFENDQISVTLKSLAIDCSDGTVSVIYQNVATGKTYGSGNRPDKVKIDNLATLVTNYPLFETFIRFKKNIL